MNHSNPNMNHSLPFPPTLISACAGAGKTHRLTNRIIGLLLMGETPSKILALTFSRKAAGEIRSRVLDRLTKGASSQSEAEKLRNEVGITSTSIESINNAIKSLTSGSHQIRFQTFDSFFIEMVRCFPAQVGLSRNVSIADVGSLKSLEQQAFERFLESRTTDQIRAFEAAFNSSFGDTSSSTTALKPHTKYKSWIASEFGPLVASPQHEWWVPNATNGEVVQGLTFWTDGSSLKAIPPKKDGSATPRARWESNLLKIRSAIEASDLDALLDSTFLQAVSGRKPQYDRADIPELFYVAWEALSHLIRGAIATSVERRISEIKPFLEEFDTFIQEIKRQHQLMSFTDCKRALLTLDISGAAEDVYYRLDGQISHILLDEFQDTSPLEWQILRPLAEEILAKSDGLERTFFCVGDSKQAIYGWRGGQSELLAALGQRYQDFLLNISENTTRRCSKNIVRSINPLFEELPHNPAFKEATHAAIAFAEEFRPHLALEAAPEGLFYLEAVPPSQDKLSKQEERVEIYQRAAKLIGDLVLKCPWAKIGVLFTQNQGIAEMHSILSGSQYNIPVSEEGKRPIERFASVSAILGLLHLIDHPRDSIEAFRLASSPLGAWLGFTDHQDLRALSKLTNQLREELSLKGGASFLSEIISHLLPKCNEDEVAELLKLEELVIASQIRGVSRARDIVEFISAAMTEDPSEAKVRLLTIHGSKGLEFDIVVLPDLDQDLVARFRRNKLLFSGHPNQPTQVSINPSQKFCQFVPELKTFKDGAFNSFIHEALCCLYVALTRGRYATYLFCGSNQPAGQGISLSSIVLSGPYQATSDFISFDSLSILGYAVGELDWWQAYTDSQPELKSSEDPELADIKFTERLLSPKEGLTTPKIGRRFLDRHSPSDPLLRYSSPDQKLSLNTLPGILSQTSEGTQIHQALSQVSWIDEDTVMPEALVTLLTTETVNELFLLNSYKNRWPESEISLYRERSLAALVTDEELGSINSLSAMVEGFRSSEVSGLTSQLLPACETPSHQALTRQALTTKEATLVTGSVDRLVIIRDSERKIVHAEIVDFKTDRPHEDRLQESIQRYTNQLNLYRLALSKSHHIPLQKITLKLAFLNLNRVISLGSD